jgi:hypothetical protein
VKILNCRPEGIAAWNGCGMGCWLDAVMEGTLPAQALLTSPLLTSVELDHGSGVTLATRHT